jgi:hypothetical protein
MVARKECARHGVGDKHRVDGIKNSASSRTLSIPAYATALEVLAANGVELMDCSILSRNQRTNKCRPFPQLAGAASTYAYRTQVPATRPAADYTARVIPHYDGVAVPLEAFQIQWQR